MLGANVIQRFDYLNAIGHHPVGRIQFSRNASGNLDLNVGRLYLVQKV